MALNRGVWILQQVLSDDRTEVALARPEYHRHDVHAHLVDQASGQPLPIGAIMEGQIISKLLLSTIMVPPFIWLFVRLGRMLDRG